MEGKHKARVEETIHQLVAGMLVRKVKDPRVANVSILRVEAARDYSVAKIFYNVIGGGDDLQDVQKGLDSCKGFMRGHVKKELRLRVIPEFIFVYDSSLDRAMALEELIDRIHEEGGPPAAEDPSPDGDPESPGDGRRGGLDPAEPEDPDE